MQQCLDRIKEHIDGGNIDEEEHELLLESIEDVDPEQRTFQKLGDYSDAFYDEGEMPDSPELKLGKRKNLDELMKSQGNEFVGSFGRDEFDEFKKSTPRCALSVRAQVPIRLVLCDKILKCFKLGSRCQFKLLNQTLSPSHIQKE